MLKNKKCADNITLVWKVLFYYQYQRKSRKLSLIDSKKIQTLEANIFKKQNLQLLSH